MFCWLSVRALLVLLMWQLSVGINQATTVRKPLTLRASQRTHPCSHPELAQDRQGQCTLMTEPWKLSFLITHAILGKTETAKVHFHRPRLPRGSENSRAERGFVLHEDIGFQYAMATSHNTRPHTVHRRPVFQAVQATTVKTQFCLLASVD